MSENEQLSALLAVCHWIGDKGWCPATGGNMSLRLNDEHCLVTESGRDKGSLLAGHGRKPTPKGRFVLQDPGLR